MKRIKFVLCCIACVVIEILLHIVSFNIFDDATLNHYSILLAMAALQVLLIYILWKRKDIGCFIVFLIVFLISAAYDMWTVVLEIQSKVSRKFDVILVAALVIDVFLLSLTLMLYYKEKHKYEHETENTTNPGNTSNR